MKKYTVGVGIGGIKDANGKFTLDHSFVTLIKKTKPVRQSGQLNLPGGKFEEGETSRECIAREWQEETSVETEPEEWTYVGKMERPGDFVVEIYSLFSLVHVGVQTMTEEEVWTVMLSDFLNGIYRNTNTGLCNEGIMPNVDIIVRHCLSPDFLKYGTTINFDYPAKPEGEENYGNSPR